MNSGITVAIRKQEDFQQFLIINGFSIEDLGEENYAVQREDELPVFVNITDNVIRFQVEVCPVSAIDSKDNFYKILDLNTDILPVSFGIDSADEANPKLVLVESRLIEDLNDSELLGVFDALELALDRAEELLSTAIEA